MSILQICCQKTSFRRSSWSTSFERQKEIQKHGKLLWSHELWDFTNDDTISDKGLSCDSLIDAVGQRKWCSKLGKQAKGKRRFVVQTKRHLKADGWKVIATPDGATKSMPQDKWMHGSSIDFELFVKVCYIQSISHISFLLIITYR